MLLDIKSCDNDGIGKFTLNYELIDGIKNETSSGKHYCKGSNSEEIANSIIDILNNNEAILQIILSEKRLQFIKERIFSGISFLSEYELSDNGEVIKMNFQINAIKSRLNKVFSIIKKYNSILDYVQIFYHNANKKDILGTFSSNGLIEIYIKNIINEYRQSKSLQETFPTVEDFSEYILCHECGHVKDSNRMSLTTEMDKILKSLYSRVKTENGIRKKILSYWKIYETLEKNADFFANSFACFISSKQISEASKYFIINKEERENLMEREVAFWLKQKNNKAVI